MRIILFFLANCLVRSDDLVNYGVDVSYPIGQRYDKLMKGCYRAYNMEDCDSTDRARIQMNLDQPRKEHNYTERGFKKLKVPIAAWYPLKEFWEANKNTQFKEEWPSGNVYVNHWDSPTSMVSLEDGRLRGYGASLKQRVWDGVKPVLEEWVGRKITPTSMYGIRVYHEGAILATHVDRLPLVTSCIINVDQDVDEPWPAEVYSHDGKAYNVTMEPGDMVLYESHTVLHGRPAPLKGRFYANIFVHFKPVDHDENNAKDHEEYGSYQPRQVTTTSRHSVAGHEQDNHDLELGKHYQDEVKDKGQTELHLAAAEGDLDKVKRILSRSKHLLHAQDVNEWQPIHEAARSGHIDVVKYLVRQGADISSKTRSGGTPLWWARRMLHAGHDVIAYLEDMGAPEEGKGDL